MLKRLLSSRRSPSIVRSSLPAGQRVYAIGDIHGRLDLLDDLLLRIERDDGARPPADTTLVFLGDLVDRGPESAGVVQRLAHLAEIRPRTRFLLGNHEEVMLSAVAGDERALKLFCRIGGRETLLSYGVSPDDYERLGYEEVHERLTALVPQAHLAFFGGFENMIVVGDYAFVHAGVRPGVAFDQQRTEDLRWIRNPFLDHRGMLEKIVVHGHTIRTEVETMPHRIGIDTGGYATGRLTALGLDGVERWLLQTDAE